MDKPICGIYKITNKINGKCYIGQSINIHLRWQTHCNSNRNTWIHQAIVKYGKESFDFEILEECNRIDLNDREQYWINQYNSFRNGYNKNQGGNQTTPHPFKITEEQLHEILNLLKYSSLTQNEIAHQFNVGIDTISEINHGKSRKIETIDYPIRKKPIQAKQKQQKKEKTIQEEKTIQKEKKTQKEKKDLDKKPKKPINKKDACPICGNPKLKTSSLCKPCSNRQVKSTIKPPKEELEKLIYYLPFTTIGKKYNVSDNAIRKWCKSYNLPFKTKDIRPVQEKTSRPKHHALGVRQLKNGICIKEYNTIKDAVIEILQNTNSTYNNVNSSIRKVCSPNYKQNKTAYGFEWEYINLSEKNYG